MNNHQPPIEDAPAQRRDAPTHSLTRLCKAGRMAPWAWIAIITLLFLVVNLRNIGDYGISVDESIGMQRGEEAAALYRSFFFGEAITNQQDYETYQLYPTLYPMWNYITSKFLEERGMHPVAAGHVLNVVVATLGLLFLALLASHLFNVKVAVYSVLFLALFPRFVAHSHYNAKDIPVMVFATLALYIMCRAQQRQKKALWILAGAAFGVALGAKLDALYVLCAFAGATAVTYIARGEWPSRPHWANCGLFASSTIVTVFLTWPLLWLDPLVPIKAFGHFSGSFEPPFRIAYLGEMIPNNEVPWHYMPMHLIAVTPIIVLGCIYVGWIFLMKEGLNRKRLFVTVLISLLIVLPIVPRCFPGVLQYDGMRHVFIVMPALAILAGVGLDAVFNALRGKRLTRLAQVPAVAGAVAWLLWQNYQVHPHQGFYLNEGVRTVVPAEDLPRYFDFLGWGTYCNHGVNWVNSEAPPGTVVHVADHLWMVWRYPLRSDIDWTDEGPADLIMFSGMHGNYISQYTEEPLLSVQCYGVNLLVIHTHLEQEGE